MHIAENLQFAERYRLIKLLGRGGFSEVWLANDQWTGLDVAVKIYSPNQSMDEDGLRDFSKELANVYTLNHTNLLKPQHVDTWQGMPYLIMAFCENGSCYKYVGRLKENDAWKLIADVASGLAYLHSRDLIHQDIKPDNILIDDNGNYLITDFGISVKARSTLRKSMSNASSGGGTTAYMAPERFSKDPQPLKSSDIWSLGATVYELITGRLPFGEVGGGMQLSGASVPTINVSISPTLRKTILRMLSEEPGQRPSASVLADWAQNPEAISLIADDDISDDGGNSFLKVRPSKVVANPAGGENSLFVKTEYDWRCFCESQKWCTVEKKSDDTLTIRLKPNQTGKERSTNINIIAGSRASIVPVSQASLPKNKKTLYVVVTSIIIVLGLVFTWYRHDVTKQARIVERLKHEYTEEIGKFDASVGFIEKDKRGFVANVFIINNALESLKEIEELEHRRLFNKTGLKPLYVSKFNLFITKLTSAKKVVDEKCLEQEKLNLSDNMYYYDLKGRSNLIQSLLDQSKQGSASSITRPPQNGEQ